MSALIWTVTFLTLAAVGLCELPTPVNLSISSHNLIHLLRWEPGPGSSGGLNYSVEVYSVRNACWQRVPECEVVDLPRVCNVTRVLPDLHGQYYFQVHATQGNQTSTSEILGAFIPMDDTYLDPPLVSVNSCKDFLCVHLRPPSSQLFSVYNLLTYNLNISKFGKQFHLHIDGLRGEKVSSLEPGVEYCVTVRIKRRNTASSLPQCTQIKAVYTADREISAGLCVLVILVLSLIVALNRCGFVCLRTTIPESLMAVKCQHVRVLQLSCNEVPYPLVHLLPLAPPIGRGQKYSSGWNSGSEEDSEGETEVETPSQRSSKGYERRGGRACRSPYVDDSSTGRSCPLGPAQTDTRFRPAELIDGQPRGVSVTGIGPLPLTDTRPPSVLGTDDGPLSVSHLSSPLDIPRALELTTPIDHHATGGPEDAGTVLEEDLSCLNVNLESLTLAGQEEEEEDEKEERKGLGHLLLAEPSVLPPTTAAVVLEMDTPSTHTTSHSTEDKEEEEEEEEEDEEDEDEECSGYMRLPLSLLVYLHVSLCVFAHLPACPAALCMLPAPLNITIVSFNLEHSLHWLAAPKTPPDARFRVQYLHLSDVSWTPVPWCLEVEGKESSCDLTDLFSDSSSFYVVRVQAFTFSKSSNWTHSATFNPILDTILGPPQVTVSGCGNCLRLQIAPPTGRAIQHFESQHLLSEFTCRVRRSRDHIEFTLRVSSFEEVLIKYLEPGVEYCVTAALSVTFNTRSVPSEPHCAYTSPTPVNTVPVMLSVLCVACLLGALFCGSFLYSGSILSLPKHLPVMLTSVPAEVPTHAAAPEPFSLVTALPEEPVDCPCPWITLHSSGEDEEDEDEEEGKGYEEGLWMARSESGTDSCGPLLSPGAHMR
ncbi:cytokine receptor family member b2 [Megalops cyprinoides]|uniref:cytokine receptor family member b2 n=1 Tax=Megalops cyprinoides TaxID=118141 RepID=UPI001864A5A3|nr:cytokine receptor family member b2 [Megalops cyprinoides]